VLYQLSYTPPEAKTAAIGPMDPPQYPLLQKSYPLGNPKGPVFALLLPYGLDHDRRAIGQNLGNAVSDLVGVITHGNHGISADFGGVGFH
jgi:hypothetical protein